MFVLYLDTDFDAELADDPHVQARFPGHEGGRDPAPGKRLGFPYVFSEKLECIGTFQIYTQWEGRGVTNTGGGVDKMVLRPGQVKKQTYFFRSY